MKAKVFFLIAVWMLFGAVSVFAAKADHTSAMGVSSSLIQSIKNDDFECFNDTLSPQSQALLATQGDPQKLFRDFAEGVRKMLKQVPEEQRPLVAMLLVSQFQKLAIQIDGKWYFDANTLTGNTK